MYAFTYIKCVFRNLKCRRMNTGCITSFTCKQASDSIEEKSPYRPSLSFPDVFSNFLRRQWSRTQALTKWSIAFLSTETFAKKAKVQKISETKRSVKTHVQVHINRKLARNHQQSIYNNIFLQWYRDILINTNLSIIY